ncbi:hypothetical protein BD779DRAFT_1672150 [Infundibulicybe gibba]|nr:hypothetical protein BD779DRAFT_1672150 [Infundibulicybe gibba]
MSIFDTTKKRPNKDTDRFRWNQSWEKDLQDSYLAFARVKNFSPPSNQEASLESHMQLYLHRQTRDICSLQTDLYNIAVQHIASEGFEDEWMKTTQARKEELVLEGLYQVSGIAPDMEGFRKWCPEATIAYLAGNGGRNFLDLLKKHIPENIGVELTKPIYIPNASVDRLIDSQPQSRATAAMVRLHRSYFLTMVLWRMILAFYGNDESYILTKTPRQSHQAVETFRGLVDKDDIREIRRLDKLESKGVVNICWNCGKDPARLGPGKELKACVKCKEIRRIIRYCSRECQREDWKNGKPVPHKAICGKPMMDVDPPEEKETVGADSNDDRIPPPDPGFRRSIALSYQITLLQSMPQCDYVLDMPPPNKDNKGFTLLNPLAKVLFHLARNRAFKNGDPEAVRFLFLSLKSIISVPGDVEILTRQLEREYGIDLANAG